MNNAKFRITKCRSQENYQVWIEFEDGCQGVVVLTDLLEKPVFQRAWIPYEKFNSVRIDPATHTLTWGEPGDEEVDINPVSLREEIERLGDSSAEN